MTCRVLFSRFFWELAEEALQVRGRRKPTGNPSHAWGCCTGSPRQQRNRGQTGGTDASRWRTPRTAAAPGRRGRRGKAGREKPQGLPMDGFTQGWVTGSQLQGVWRQEGEETQGVLRR